MFLMTLLVVAGSLYFVVVLAAMGAFSWYVVHALRGLANEQMRTREMLDRLLTQQEQSREHAEHDV